MRESKPLPGDPAAVVEPKVVDKAGRAFWDRTWQPRGALWPTDPALAVARDPYLAEQRSVLLACLSAHGPDARVLEVGCARSLWLAHLASQHVRVSGIDYSAVGCAQTSQLLRAHELDAEIRCADALSPPDDWLNAFDVVMSFGVAEHFTDTAMVLRAFARYLKPAGHLLTVIPNMTGLPGAIQRLLDPNVFAVHVPLGVDELRASHNAAGLQPLICRPTAFANAGVVNPGRLNKTFLRPFISGTFTAINATVRAVERVSGALPANAVTSPYFLCLARTCASDAPE